MRAGIQKLEYSSREESVVLLEFSWAFEPPPYTVVEPIEPTVFHYSLFFRIGTSGSWTTIAQYKTDGSLGYSDSFLMSREWKYQHESKTLSDIQYYYQIVDSSMAIKFQSYILTVPKFAGWGSKNTRISANDSVKQQRKTRLKTPRF